MTCSTAKFRNGAATMRICVTPWAFRSRTSESAHCLQSRRCLRKYRGEPASARRIRSDHWFRRRAATYKRADLLFNDIERLKSIAASADPIQILYAGKAHPHDGGGKALIQRVIQASERLKDFIKIVYVENYNMALAKFITSGVDLWLNTPQRPQEASGTSGMKAA